MHITKIAPRLLIAVALTLPAGAQDPAPTQDTITLKGGGQLVGEILQIGDDSVKIDTPALGTVVVPAAEIADMHTDRPVAIRLDNGERVEVTIQSLEDGILTVGSGADIREIALSDLTKAIESTWPRWSGSLTIGASSATGNTNVRSVNTQFDIEYRTVHDRVTGTFSWDYSDDKDPITGQRRLIQRRVGGGAQYDYFFSKDFYGLANVYAQSDEFQDLDLRFTSGLGAGYVLIDDGPFKLSGEAGISYFLERFTVGPDKSYPAARLAYSLAWTLWQDIVLTQDTNWLPSLESFDDQYLRVATGVSVPMVADLFAKFQWIVEWNSSPAPGLEQTDQRFLLSIGWSF